MISISENYIAYEEDSTWFLDGADAAFRLPHLTTPPTLHVIHSA